MFGSWSLPTIKLQNRCQAGCCVRNPLNLKFVGFLRRGCSRGGGNWGTLRIPREDWGTLGNIRED